VLKNIQAAGYGRTVTAVLPGAKNAAQMSQFTVRYNPSSASAVINYTLQNARHMTINVFNQQGKPVATLVNGVISAGMHKAVWDAKRAPAGVYVARLVTDGDFGWSGKIVIGK
jgi:hypothetical protein